MPYLVALSAEVNHYCVKIGDLKSKTCIFYNPLPKSQDDASNGHQKFRRFLNQLHITQYGTHLTDANTWTYIEGQGAEQRDGVNCGVYVIRFVERFLMGYDQTKDKFNIPQYRTFLQLLCLEQSSNMSNLCLYCGKGETKKSKLWTMCDTCKRWVHHETCLKQYVNMTEEEAKSTIVPFQCIVCLGYQNKYNDDPWNVLQSK